MWSLLAVLSCLSSGLVAAEPVLLDLARWPVSLAGQARWLVDPTAALTAEQVADATLQPAERWTFDLSTSPEATTLWLSFTVEPLAAARAISWLVAADWPALRSATLYLVDPAGGVTQRGRAYPSGEVAGASSGLGQVQAFLLGPLAEGPNQFLLRLETAAGLGLPVELWPAEAYLVGRERRMLGFGVYYGIMLLMVGFNLYLGGWLVRDRSHLWYAIYVLFLSLYFAVDNEPFLRAFAALDRETLLRLQLACLGAGLVTAGQFARQFLHTPGRPGAGDRALVAVMLASSPTVLLAWLTPLTITAAWLLAAVLLTVGLLIGLGLATWRRRYRPARFFVVGWTCFGLGMLVRGLVFAQVVPFTALTASAAQVGHLAEALLLSLALADRILALRREREDLREREAYLRSVLDTAPFAIAIVRQSERHVSYANHRFSELFQVPLAAVGQHPVEHYLAPVRWDELRRRLVAEGRADDLEISLAAAGADRRGLLTATSLEYHGEAAVLLAIAEITKRLQAERALRQSEARLQLIYDSSSDLLFLAGLTPDGGYRLISANRSCLAHLNMSAEQVVGRRLDDLLPVATAQRWRGHLDRARQSLLTVHLEDRLALLHGEFDLDVSLTPILDEHGQVQSILCSARDITSRKHLEEQLHQAGRMAAIGQLSAGIAHNFNNLLTVICGYCELLTGSLADHPTALRGLGQIRQAADRAVALTSALMEFGRRQIRQPERLDLNELLRRLELVLTPLMGERTNLFWELADELGEVTADRAQIEQVVVNLVTNARDAMPDGGSLTIQTRNLDASEDDVHRGLAPAPGPWVVLTVTDTGCGMDEATRARVFEPFFTTKGLASNTGLGLASVYGVVKQSAGHIECSSAPGEGTTFAVYLPRCGAAPSVGPAGEPLVGYDVATWAQRSNGPILVVEDEDAVRQIVCTALRDRGYTVIEASSAEEALAQVATGLEGISLLVTDVVMPGLNGPELYRHLRQYDRSLPALLISGYTEPQEQDLAGLGEAWRTMAKPFTPSQLVAEVEAMLAGAADRSRLGD